MYIEQSTDKEVFKKCARLMHESEPWITLNRTYEQCMLAMEGDYKEVYIVTDNNALTGFAVLQMAGTFRGYIQTICIAADHRNKGIGKALLRFCEDRILRESPNIFMCVSSFNMAVARLYYSLGFEKVGELKNFIVNGHSEILLRKTIGPTTGFTPNKLN